LSSLARLFADNIVPIILVAGVGFALRRLLNVDVQSVSRVAFYVCIPALVFSLLLNTQIKVTDVLRMMAFAAIIVTCVGILAWLVARWLRLPPSMTAAFILASAFMNSGNYGLSVNNFAFGQNGLAWASLFYITTSLLTNSVGVYIATVGHASPGRALLGLLRVPAVYSIPLALLVRAFGLALPVPLARPIDLLAASAVPLMLLILGMQLAQAGLPTRKGLLTISAGLRLLIGPAIAWFLAPALGLIGVSRQAGILEAAMPTAVFNAILALEFNIEPEFVTGAVLVSTLLSPLTLTPLIALLGG
jgi:predicted permease